MIQDLAGPGKEEHAASIERFLLAYWRPMKAFITWKFKGLNHSDQDDLLQGFIASRLLAQSLYKNAVAGDVSFRPYLKRSLANFVIDDLRGKSRYRRLLEKYASGVEQVDGEDPLDFEWARTVIVESMERFRRECLETDRQIVWEVFDLRVRRPAYDGQPAVAYPLLSAKFGRTAIELRNLLVTGKRMMRRHLYDIVSGYVVGDAEVEAEIRDLQRIAAGGMGWAGGFDSPQA